MRMTRLRPLEHFCELQISNGGNRRYGPRDDRRGAPNLSCEEHRKLLRMAAGVSRGTPERELISKRAVTGAQLRAARALLKWSVRDLSDRCGVSRSAISRGEKVDGTPPMHERNFNTIRTIFEEQGIEFLDFNGVRMLLPR